MYDVGVQHLTLVNTHSIDIFCDVKKKPRYEKAADQGDEEDVIEWTVVLFEYRSIVIMEKMQ